MQRCTISEGPQNNTVKCLILVYVADLKKEKGFAVKKNNIIYQINTKLGMLHQ